MENTWNALLHRWVTKPGCCSHPFISHWSEVLRTTLQAKEIKGTTIERKRKNFLLFVDGMIVYVENPKKSTKSSRINKWF